MIFSLVGVAEYADRSDATRTCASLAVEVPIFAWISQLVSITPAIHVSCRVQSHDQCVEFLMNVIWFLYIIDYRKFHGLTDGGLAEPGAMFSEDTALSCFWVLKC